MLEKGKELNESLEFYKEQLEENGYLLSVNNGVSKLQSSIEEKLIANKGNNIIDGHKKYITSLFERKIEKLRKELGEYKNSLNTILSDQDDLDRKQSNITRTKERISSYFEGFKVQLSSQQDRFVNNFESEISKVKREISDSVREELSRIRNTSHFANEAQWIVKNNIEKEIDKFEELGKNQEKKFQENLNESIDNLIEEIDTFKAFNPEQLRSIVSFASSYECRNIGSSISNQFSADHVNSVVKDSTIWFQRWFDTKGGLDNIRSSIMHEVNLLLEKEFNINMLHSIRDAVKTGSDKLRTNVEKEINQALSKMQEETKKIQNFVGDKQEKSKEYQKSIETVSRNISNFESSKRKFEELLNGK
jgi:chromosome segregation ATPase